EDGIRDDLVTGVQTCALPICGGRRRGASPRGGHGGADGDRYAVPDAHPHGGSAVDVQVHREERVRAERLYGDLHAEAPVWGQRRSEERRVGKVGGESGWGGRG